MSPKIKKAANWYLANKHNHSGNFTAQIMKRFDLKPKQCVQAYLLADKISRGVSNSGNFETRVARKSESPQFSNAVSSFETGGSP
jgi:hypothetical protein